MQYSVLNRHSASVQGSLYEIFKKYTLNDKFLHLVSLIQRGRNAYFYLLVLIFVYFYLTMHFYQNSFCLHIQLNSHICSQAPNLYSYHSHMDQVHTRCHRTLQKRYFSIYNVYSMMCCLHIRLRWLSQFHCHYWHNRSFPNFSLLAMIALSAVQSFARILSHNANLFVKPQQCLKQQRSLDNWEATFGDWLLAMFTEFNEFSESWHSQKAIYWLGMLCM